MEIEIDINGDTWVCCIMENDQVVSKDDLASKGYLKTIYRTNIPMIKKLQFTQTEHYGKMCKEYWVRANPKNEIEPIYITKIYLKRLYKKE
jgi:protein-arginine kinase activator protein McsA